MTYRRSTHWISLVMLSLMLLNTGLLMMITPGIDVGYEIARAATIPFVISCLGWFWALAADTGLGDAARRYSGGEEA